ncbi:MAG TPA: hypothetical protein VH877_28335 [Polyangia bacterium]|nr:hypothetical protein [Polyangia bacterium]
MRSFASRLVLASWASCVLLVTAETSLPAAEITDVTSSAEKGHPFGFRIAASYSHLEKRAAIQREIEVAGADDIRAFKDLRYTQRRDTLNLRAEIGLFRDLMVYGGLPLVLSDSRELRYDQSLGAGCVFPGDPNSAPTCVNAGNSSTVADGILPASGFDARAGGAAIPGGSSLVFRGPRRGGSGTDLLDTVNVGITWAVFNQKRDDTKPTWTLNFEAQISIGNLMRFDRANPDANHGVSEGLHRLVARTAISKRFRYFDPYIGFWYLFPTPRKDTLFLNYGPAQQSQRAQQKAGTVFGVELIPLDLQRKSVKLALQFQGRIEGRFEGRGYSEIWEILAGAGPLACNPAQNPACSTNNNPISNPYQGGQPYTGITTIQDHAVVGADFSLILQAGKWVRLGAQFQYTREQGHLATIDGVGQALDTNCQKPTDGPVTRPCEFNPAYRPVINQVGRRYRIDDIDLYNVGGWAQFIF